MKRYYATILIIIGLLSAALLINYALKANLDLFYTPSEALYGKSSTANKPEIGQRIRVGGMVKKNSFVRDPATLLIRFTLYDARGELTVLYQGLLPDLFQEEGSAIVQGHLTDANTLLATEVLAKHDENYRPREVSQAMETHHALAATSPDAR